MKKSYTILGLVLVIIATVANLIYWGTQKEGFNLDEDYTYGYCCEFNSNAIIHNTEEGEFFNNWHGSGLFLDYYTINDEEAFDYKSALVKMKVSCHPPLFYLLFFTLASIVRNYSKWIGIVINIGATVLSLLGIYGISRRMSKNNRLLSIGICGLFGLNAVTASNVVLIRMYALLTMMTILFIYVHALAWDKFERLKEDKKRIKWYLLFYVVTVLGTLTHYFFIVYAFFFCALFCLYLLKRKNRKVCLEYGIAQLLGVGTAVALYPAMLSDIRGSRGSKTTTELVSTTSNFSGKIKSFANIINKNVFGKTAVYILVAVLILALVILIMRIVSAKQKKQQDPLIAADDKPILAFYLILLFTTLLYLFFVAKCTQYNSLRYIQNACPIVLLIFFFTLYYLLERISGKVVFKVILFGCFVLVTVFSYTENGVQNLYRGTGEQLEIAKNYAEYPIVCVYDGGATKQKQYYAKDSVYFLYGQKVYTGTTMVGKEIFDELEEQPDAFLLFLSETYSEEDREDYVARLTEETGSGNVELLFETEKNYVYLIEK